MPCYRLPPALGFALAAFLCGPSACIGFAAHDDNLPLRHWAEARGVRRAKVDLGRYIGISDVAPGLDGNGTPAFYLVPERQRALLRLVSNDQNDQNDQAQAATFDFAVQTELRGFEGLPFDHDTESLAFVDADHLVLGTETPWPNRTHDDVLLVRRGNHAGKVVARWPFAYAPFGLRGQSNQGLEGLCVSGNVLVAASETTGRLEGGQRYTPLGWRALTEAEGAFVPLRLRLSSPTGKISALACRPGPTQPGEPAQPTESAGHGGSAQKAQPQGAVEVLAIERHYGTGRILRFVLPAKPTALADIVPQVALDLATLMPRLPNYEGIAWLANGDLLLVTDNSMGFATGPTEILVVPKNLLGGAQAVGLEPSPTIQ